MMAMEESLKEFLETGKNWERIGTKTPGLFIRRMPGSSNRSPSLAIELNPPNHTGKPTKRNGLFIRSQHDVEFYREMLGHPQIDKILESLLRVNPEREKERTLNI